MKEDYSEKLKDLKENAYYRMTFKVGIVLDNKCAMMLAIIYNLTNVFRTTKQGFVYIDTATFASLINDMGVSTLRKKAKWLKENKYIYTKKQPGTNHKYYKLTNKARELLNLPVLP